MSETGQKLVIVGDSGTGKTQLFNLWTGSCFEEQYRATPGVTMKTFTVKFAAVDYLVQICDTPGDDKEGNEICFEGATGVIVVFAVNSKDGFEQVETLIRQVRSVAGEIPAVLIGTKMDDPERCVYVEEAELLGVAVRAVYVETSAKNVDMTDVAKRMACMYVIDTTSFNQALKEQQDRVSPVSVDPKQRGSKEEKEKENENDATVPSKCCLLL